MVKNIIQILTLLFCCCCAGFSREHECLKDQADGVLLKIVPAEYVGAYHIDWSGPGTQPCTETQSFRLKAGTHTLMIANSAELNLLEFGIDSRGNIKKVTPMSDERWSGLKISRGQIKFLNGDIRLDKGHYEGGCSLSPFKHIVNQTVCNGAPVHLVKGFHYYLELNGAGMNDPMWLGLDRRGQIASFDNERAIEIGADRRTLIFKTLQITINSNDHFSGQLIFGTQTIDSLPKTLDVVPYVFTTVYFRSMETYGKRFIRTPYFPLPSEMKLRDRSGSDVTINFTCVFPPGEQDRCSYLTSIQK